MRHYYEAIPGWFDFEGTYIEAVQAVPDGGTMVEIGSWFGRSFAFLAVEAINSGKRLNLFAVDTWKGAPSQPALMETVEKLGGDIYQHFCDNMIPALGKWKANLLPNYLFGGLVNLSFLRMESVQAVKTFADESVDFVFIDADHDYEHCAEDIRNWSKKLKPGGILAGHDYYDAFPGVMQAVQELVPDREVRGRTWIRR